MKSALKYQQVPMKKEISFTLHGWFIVSWKTRKNISNNFPSNLMKGFQKCARNCNLKMALSAMSK
jgi:hypothetical protein